MYNKFTSIFIIFLLIFAFGIQVAEADSDTANVRVSVSIIEPDQDLNYSQPLSFEYNDEKTYTSSENNKITIEYINAGCTVINSNLPWEIYAEVPEFENADVYVKNDRDNEWVKVYRDRPVIDSFIKGQTTLNWDIKVVTNDVSELRSFDVEFRLDWQKNN
ncbi:MAG: hypothetical protein KGY44_09475 [Halanaerobiales bacterium]|nr:hypothetical protein [Halanaerobiales bacterium]